MIPKLWPEMTAAEQVQAILIMEAALASMCERMSREMTEFLNTGKAPFKVELTGRLVKIRDMLDS